MKIASYRVDNKDSFGIVTEKGIVDLRDQLGGEVTDLKSLLDQGLDALSLKKIVSSCESFLSTDDVEFLPVIPNPGAIFCLGMNTHSHVAEIAKVSSEHKNPQKPAMFMRASRTQVGHNQALEKPNGSPLFDYEGEMAIIIGKRGRHVPKSEALDYVAGYACYNDASVRDYQLHSHMFTSGKNFPRSGGFGPWLATADEVGNPESFVLTTRLNGNVMQTLTYDDLIYNFNEIISYVSEFTELQPGDVIVTGSPAGSALFANPQLWLQVGDVVEVEVSCVGVLTNTIEPAEGINVAPETRLDAKEVFLEALAYAKNR